jgi:hypothetical protein
MGPILKTAGTRANPDRPTDRVTDGPRRPPQRNTLWEDKLGHRFKGFVMTPDVLLAAAVRTVNGSDASSLMAIQIKSGEVIWHKALPAPVVRGGIAVDSQARIVLALENGQVICLQ